MVIEAAQNRIQVPVTTTNLWKTKFKHGDRQKLLLRNLEDNKQRIIDGIRWPGNKKK